MAQLRSRAVMHTRKLPPCLRQYILEATQGTLSASEHRMYLFETEFAQNLLRNSGEVDATYPHIIIIKLRFPDAPVRQKRRGRQRARCTRDNLLLVGA